MASQSNISLIPQNVLDEIKQYEERIKAADKATSEIAATIDGLRKALSSSQSDYRTVKTAIDQLERSEQELAKTEQDRSKSVDGLSQAMDKAVKTTNDLNKERKEERSLIEISTKAYQSAAKSIDYLTENQEALRRELNSTRSEIKSLTSDFDKGNISNERYYKRIVELRNAERELNSSVQQLGRQIKNNQTIISTSIGSYSNLSAQYSLLKDQINQLSDSETVNGYTKHQLEAQAKSLYEEMKRLQEQTGKNQLNVGNYSEANKQLLQTINMVIPGAGRLASSFGNLSQILTSLSQSPVLIFLGSLAVAIGAAYKAFTFLYETAQNNERQAYRLKEAFAPIAVVQNEVTNASVSFTDSLLDNLDVILEYLTYLPTLEGAIIRVTRAFGYLSGATDSLNDKAEEQRRFISDQQKFLEESRKFRIKESEEEIKIAELRAVAVDRENKTTNERLAALDDVIKIEERLAEERVAIANENLRLLELEASFTENSKDFNDQLIQAEIERNKAISDLQATYRQNTRERNAILKEQTAEEKSAAAELKRIKDEQIREEKERQKELKAEITAQLQLEQQRGNILNEENRRILEDQKQGYLARLNANEQFYDQQQKNIETARDIQLQNDTLTATQRLAIQEKSNYDLLTAERNYIDNFRKITDDNLKEQQAQIQTFNSNKLLDLKISQTKEETALAQSYASGEITKRQYEQEKTDIQARYSQERFNVEVATLNQLAELYIDDVTEYEKYQKQIADITARFAAENAKIQIKSTEDSVREREQLERQYINAVIQLTTQLNDTIFSLLDSRLERQLQVIDEELDSLTKFYEEKAEQIEYQEARGLISSEYAAQQRQYYLDQEAEAQEELAQKKAEIQRKQAEQDKLQSIFSATIATAVAVAQALPNLILAGIVGAAGAAQIATIIAQPLPQYAEGTADHPGGLAYVGDGGKSEMILTPSGGVYKTPDRPTLIDLPKHSEVLPDFNKAMMQFPFSELSGNNVVVINDGKQVSLLGKSISVMSDARDIGVMQLKEMYQHKKLMRRNMIESKFSRLFKN